MLEAGIDLLEVPTRDVPVRQRSVRVVFDHSWALLVEREKEVLRRLSVFRGGFSLQAAAAVVDATLPMLARLVDKSLLHMSTKHFPHLNLSPFPGPDLGSLQEPR